MGKELENKLLIFFYISEKIIATKNY